MPVLALERVGNKLRLIDQTRLPTEVVYRELDNYKDIINAIVRLEVRGAPAIGIAAAYALAIAALQTNASGYEQIKTIGEEIKGARPTAVNLFWAVDRVVNRVATEHPASPDLLVALLWDEAEKIHAEDRAMCARIGTLGAQLFSDGDSILTHCNTGALATGGIGTALAAIYTAHEQGKRIKVFADETRPLLQGARLTAWELQQAGIDVTLICDNTAGMLMKQGKIQHIIVGADRITRNGDAANKIGTYSVAVLANYHQIPFYVAAPASTFDCLMESGDDIVIEERSALEVTNGFGKRTAPEGVKVYSPAFDVTPFALISCFVTDTGLRPGGR